MKTRARKANKKRSEQVFDPRVFAGKKHRKDLFDVNKLLSFMMSDLKVEASVLNDIKTIITQLASLMTVSAKKHDIDKPDFLFKLILTLVSATHPDQLSLEQQRDEFIKTITKSIYGYMAFMTGMAKYLNDSSSAVLDLVFQTTDEYESIELLWMFMLISHKKYSEHLEVDLAYVKDYVSIRQLFLRSHLTGLYLDKLETMLQAHVVESANTAVHKRPDGMYMLPLAIPNIYKRHHILSSVLDKWAETNGFVGRAKIMRAISPQKFSAILSSTMLLKDAATQVGDTHGAWSHALQWFFIVEHNKANPGFLQHAPLTLYKNVSLVWNLLLDAQDMMDASCPEYLTDLISKPASQERWPLLSGSVLRAHAKMYALRSDYPGYLLKKHGEQIAVTQGFDYTAYKK